MTHASRFVGIDISKSSFDICILPERQLAAFANTAEGICAFIALMADFAGIERLVIEPTGGYERGVVDALLAARLPVAKVNAKQVRQFAAPAASSPRPTGLMPSCWPTMAGAWKPRS